MLALTEHEVIPFFPFPMLPVWVNAAWAQSVRMAFWHQIEIKSHFFLLPKFPLCDLG